ncbi:HECT domain protein [Aspergillus clavatus NRRL 1]|uniref:HECT-type E3 ubiquitin transferase n=1 Tax=Aspergillus clavatus (strain ATCC 1007 / CBS 513.65 / DSM 816 / NCTC 3887 / NRRL 1 / QM 1276 / 107) TaxID=344612 RepID=A1CEM0_ASPCL|nr:HECT domain protein [Aspergillus clavatus NRRL 1]EAW11319.1 HECT domain protein [Aspergillus clavatus NRRL 1]
MTRLRGASVSSYDASRSPTGVDRSHLHRSKLPPNAPDVIVENTIDVSDPAQVLLWYRDERRRQFNLLVRKYKNQLLYGCQDPACRTPTCASYRRRVSEGPYRRYTELSARTLACYLASLDNPEAGLCRNTPRVHSELSSHDHQRSSRRSSRGPPPDRSTTRNVSSPSGLEKVNDDLIRQAPAQISASSPQSSAPAKDTPEPFVESQKQIEPSQDEDPAAQRMKDPKSFTQNLFDTLSLRMVEWLPLRRLPDAPGTESQCARPPKRETCCEHSDSAEKEPEGGRRASIHTRQVGSAPHTPSSRDVSRLAPAVETKPNSQVKRIAVLEADQHHPRSRSIKDERLRTELRPSRKLSINAHISADESINIPSPPALKHRQQKHRGRFEDLDASYTPEQQRKGRRVSWDSAKLLDDVQNSETQKSLAIKDEQLHVEDQPANDPKSNRKSSRSRRERPFTVQTLTHIDGAILGGLERMLVQSEEDAQRWKDELAHIDFTGNFENPEWQYATSGQRRVYTFVAQSVFYALGNPSQILRSFHGDTAGPSGLNQSSPTTKLNLQQLQLSLRKLFTLCPWDIVLHSLWRAMETLFVPPKELSMPGRQSRRSSTNSATTGSVSVPIISRRSFDSAVNDHVDDANAADIATIALFALISSLPAADAPTWRALLQMRAAGTVASTTDMEKVSVARSRSIVEITDRFEHELALRLIDRLVRGLTARLAFHEISKVRRPNLLDSSSKGKKSVLDLLLDNLANHYSPMASGIDEPDRAAQPPAAAAIIAEWLRTLFLRNWDGNPEISRSSSAGGVVEILSRMYKQRNHLGLVPKDFHTPLLSERLDPLEMPVEWLGRLSNNKTMHLLSYSFLFPPSALVIYFRALNYSAMSKAYEAAMTTTRHVTQTAFGPIPIQDDVRLLAEMKTSMTSYLVLMVRRDNVLTDALNQLWRREKRELLRPLKVQMGMDEGEEGLDHGGVQQEFFRVVMAAALDPSYGMFTMDERTRVSWFQPCSLEPLYKFELFGLLMSLAIYNGVTLPVNFPIAFYRKLLGLKVKHLDHIQDGWPELSKGLGDLLTWQDGDVGDVFMRTYEFSFEAFGSVETVDMEKVDKDAVWPLPTGIHRKPFILPSKSWSELSDFAKTADMDLSPPCSMAADDADDSSPDLSHRDIKDHAEHSVPTPPVEEASLVTNKNRAQFVKDYIFWLTDQSIRTQFDAFTRGFYTCLDRAALSIFTPEAFKTVVEGIQEIDIKELERHARYEGGFGPSHPTIRGFWSIVRGYSAEKRARLLEFVTASDRVPVNGIASIMFVIQKNGVGDARLPTSLTCFGRLLLPEYSSKKVLEEKLDKALENARGFGVA